MRLVSALLGLAIIATLYWSLVRVIETLLVALVTPGGL